MTARSIAATLCSCALTTTFLAASAGCASLQARLNQKLLDYATVEQDARITVSGENSGFSAESLIDGVTEVEAWNADSGWEYSFQRTRVMRSGRLGSVEANMSRGSAWALIEFPHIRRINRIAVHTLNTIAMPSSGIVSGLAQVRTPADVHSPWKTVGQVEKGYLITLGKQATRARPTTTFRFNQVEADAVRVVIYSMGDSEGAMADAPETESRYWSNSAQDTTVRLVEIEVTGSVAAPTAERASN